MAKLKEYMGSISNMAREIQEPDPKRITVERWQSSDNQREVHFFVAGTQTYVAGMNPDLVDSAKFVKFLGEQGFTVLIGEHNGNR